MAPLVTPKRGGTPQANQAGATAEPRKIPMVPFVRGARKKTALAFQTTVQQTTGTVQLNPIEIPSAGILRFIELQVTATAAANAATVAFQADAPFNALSWISLQNSGGDSILVPFTGYNLYLINKYFCASEDPPSCDPRADFTFSAHDGDDADSGSFNFTLRIPLEIDPRDAFCAVPNSAANKAYLLQLQLAPSSAVYSVAPTTLPTVTVTGYNYYWTQPNGSAGQDVAVQPVPAGNGSVALLRYQTETINGGDQRIKLVNVGNVIRGLIFVLRDGSGVRTVADWPAISQIILNNDTMFYLPIGQWQNDIANGYDYHGTIDEVKGLDTGVFTLPYFLDQRGRVLCDGPRDQYLPTLDATLLQLQGTSFGNSAARLEIISHEIKPISADALYAPNIA